MKNNLLKKAVSYIGAEKRISMAVVILALTFLTNQALYIGKRITAENCSTGKCILQSADKPQLTKDSAYYYVDDLFKDLPAGYYRLTFQEKADRAEKILLKLNTYAEKESQVGELALVPADTFQKQEVLFFLPEGYSSLLVQKEDEGSVGNIFIDAVSTTKLNITNQTELASMQKTIFGETDASVAKISQLGSRDAFSWLKEDKTMLGQIFQAKDGVISAADFKIDIVKDLNPSSRQYVMSLREVEYDGENVSFTGPMIASISFSLNSIEKYRQADGTFHFPLYGMLQKDKYYLISLDNSKVGVSGQDYLEFRGDRNNDSYPNGSVVIKKGTEAYLANGDLYFKIYGADYHFENGTKILNDAKIEDLGKGLGKYSYSTQGAFIDLLDLDAASLETEFSENYKVIFAPAKDNANFGYAVNTIFPISKMNFSASQLSASWKKVKVSYSFDQNNWIDLASSEKAELVNNSTSDSVADQSSPADGADNTSSSENTGNSNSAVSSTGDSSSVSDGSSGGAIMQESLQVFDTDIVPTKEVRTVYFRITYDPNDTSKGRFFALKDLKITADLKMNPSLVSDRLK